MGSKGRFGEQRLVQGEAAKGKRLLFRLIGIGDPGHYLRSLYFRRALRHADGVSVRRILDGGCGGGDYSFYLARLFPDAQVLGADVREAAIKRNRETAQRLGLRNVRFETMDLAGAELPDDYDLIVCIDVIQYIADQERALSNLAAALRPGGLAFFHSPTVREKPAPFSRWLGRSNVWVEREPVAEERTAQEFVRLVQSAGLELVSVQRTFGYWTGELATSLFDLPYTRKSLVGVQQALLAPACRLLCLADPLGLERNRYAIAVLARKEVT